MSLCFFVAKQSLHLVVSNRTYLYLISFEKWWHFGSSSRMSFLILPGEVTQHYQITALLIFKYSLSIHFPNCLRSTRGRWICVCLLIELLKVWRASVKQKDHPSTRSCTTSSVSAAPWWVCSYAWLVSWPRFWPAFLAHHSSFLSLRFGWVIAILVTEDSWGETLDLFFYHPRQSYWVSLPLIMSFACLFSLRIPRYVSPKSRCQLCFPFCNSWPIGKS